MTSLESLGPGRGHGRFSQCRGQDDGTVGKCAFLRINSLPLMRHVPVLKHSHRRWGGARGQLPAFSSPRRESPCVGLRPWDRPWLAPPRCCRDPEKPHRAACIEQGPPLMHSRSALLFAVRGEMEKRDETREAERERKRGEKIDMFATIAFTLAQNEMLPPPAEHGELPRCFLAPGPMGPAAHHSKGRAAILWE